jgi:hypothetical protein
VYEAKKGGASGSTRPASTAENASRANEASPSSPTQDQHCQNHQRPGRPGKGKEIRPPQLSSGSQQPSPKRLRSQAAASEKKAGVLSQAGSEPWSSHQGQGPADEGVAASFIDDSSKKRSRQAPSVNYRAKQAEKDKADDKFKTNMDLIFIRKLRDIDGLKVYSDPACEINLMYEHERNLHFRK